MENVLKWAVVAGVIFVFYRWWGAGAHANLNLGPGQYDGYPGWNIPQAGYTFSGPGVVVGFNPDSFARRGHMASVSEY